MNCIAQQEERIIVGAADYHPIQQFSPDRRWLSSNTAIIFQLSSNTAIQSWSSQLSTFMLTSWSGTGKGFQANSDRNNIQTPQPFPSKPHSSSSSSLLSFPTSIVDNEKECNVCTFWIKIQWKKLYSKLTTFTSFSTSPCYCAFYL